MKCRQGKLLRVSDLEACGYTRFQIPTLLRRGELTRMSRGLYYWSNAQLSAHSTIAAVSSLVPQGIVCLLTALRFHDLGTQNPAPVWIAIPTSYRPPKITGIPVKTVHFGGKYRKIGIVDVDIDGVTVHITNPERTIVDCFRFRNRIGLDVAIEALEDGARKKAFTVDELVTTARTCRIYGVMRPYMETLYR